MKGRIIAEKNQAAAALSFLLIKMEGGQDPAISHTGF